MSRRLRSRNKRAAAALFDSEAEESDGEQDSGSATTEANGINLTTENGGDSSGSEYDGGPRSLQGLGSSKAQQRPLHHSELARYARLIKGSNSNSKLIRIRKTSGVSDANPYPFGEISADFG